MTTRGRHVALLALLAGALGCDPPPSEPGAATAYGSEPVSVQTATATASPRPAPPAPAPEPSGPALPPDPPPAVPELASEVPTWEAKLAANKAYQTALAGGDDFTLLVSGVADMLASGGVGGRIRAPLVAKKPLFDGAVAVYMVWLRTNRLPEPFRARVQAELDAGRSLPRRGVWAPFEPGKVPHDWTPLAVWMHRDDHVYLRELLAQRAQPMAQRVTTWETTAAPPPRPYLVDEQAALEWLARVDPLTPAEERRLGELRLEAATTAVPIETLLGEYRDNEIRADAAYKGKLVRTTGVVGDVKKDITGSIYVTVGTGQPFEIPKVQCFFEAGQEAAVTSLSRGDRVTVRGTVSGLMLNVLVKGCGLVK